MYVSIAAIFPGEGSVWQSCSSFRQQGAAIEWVRMVVVLEPNFRGVELFRDDQPSGKAEEIVPNINAAPLKSSVFFSLE